MKKHLLILITLLTGATAMGQQYKVTFDKAEHGSYTVSPALPKSGMYKAGTVLTVKATPDKGYTFDSGYYTASEDMPWGRLYFETMTPEFKITVHRNIAIGAYFVKQQATQGLVVTQDIVFAQPGKKPLKYDVYAPKGAKNLPCIVIIHGGGWSSNTEDIMRGMAREMARTGKYVVFSMDYRWLGTLDGDKTPNEPHQIIEDVYGGLLHIMEHAAAYGGDPSKLLLTGDSAGGHLSASAANFVERIGDRGFGKTEDVYEFKPTYLPKGKTLIQVRTDLAKAIKAVSPTYGVFSAGLLSGPMKDKSDAYRKAIAPIESIPNAKERYVPQLLFRGTEDPIISDQEVRGYEQALIKAGQRAEYIEVGGASHAFFDWKPEVKTQAVFERYGVYHIKEMLLFFDDVLDGK